MKNDKTFIFGINSVAEKLKAAPEDVIDVLIVEGPQRPALRSIDADARRLGLQVRYVRPDALRQLAGGERHQGAAARVQDVGCFPFAEFLKKCSSPPSSEWVLILDGLTDPRNAGALMRTAEAVGVKHIVIPKDRAVGITSVVAQASAGAVHHLKIFRATNLRRALQALKQHGFWTVGLDAQAPRSIYQVAYPTRLGIVVGSEGRGLRPLIVRECDYRVSIPMLGKIESLNVAVAGAVFLYELLRQRVSVDRTPPKS